MPQPLRRVIKIGAKLRNHDRFLHLECGHRVRRRLFGKTAPARIECDECPAFRRPIWTNDERTSP